MNSDDQLGRGRVTRGVSIWLLAPLVACAGGVEENPFGVPTGTSEGGTAVATTDGSGSTTSGSSTDGGSTAGGPGSESTSDDDETGAPPRVGGCPTLGEWSVSEPFASGDDTSHPLPSFAVGEWMYVHTITGGDRVLWSATPGADGTLGPWQVASDDHGGGPHGYTAVAVDEVAFHFRNGHIAEYTFDAAGHMLGDVVLHEDDTSSAFGGDLYVWDSAVLTDFGGDARGIVHLGGFSFGPYAYRPIVRRSPIPIASSFSETGIEHPASRPGKSAFVLDGESGEGWIFSGEGGGDPMWSTSVTPDGAVGAWQQLASLPAGTDNERGDLFAAGRSLFVVRGASVFRAKVDAGGTLGEWTQMPSLPQPQIDVTWGDDHLEGAAWGRIGDFVYVTGPKAVFGARLVDEDC